MTGAPNHLLGLLALLSAACGPSVGGPVAGDQDTGTAGTDASSTGRADSDSGGDRAESGTTGDPASTSDQGASSSGAPVQGTVPAYAVCQVDMPVGGPGEPSDCLPGLLCGLIGEFDTAPVCTQRCETYNDASVCPPVPEGYAPMCAAFWHGALDPFCAIACDENEGCPEGYVCGTASPYSPPYYCVLGA